MKIPSSFSTAFSDLVAQAQAYQLLPLDLMRALQQLADLHLSIAAFEDYHDKGEQWELARSGYNAIGELFFQLRRPHLAHRVMQNWWIALGAEQQRTGRRYPLAAPTQWLSQIFFWVGDMGLAARWSLLTAAHDVQMGLNDSLALQEIQATFGLDERTTGHLVSLAKDCAAEAHDDWGQPCGFPEEVVQQLIRHAEGRDAYTAQMANHATRHEFPVSPGYLRALIARLDAAKSDATITEKERGDRLEAIARYLTSLLPGSVPRANLLSADNAFESDIIVANVYTQPTIISDLFGRYILVECKNYGRPVDVSRVGYFLHRMRMVHASFGILFATSSVTGSNLTDEEQAARAMIRRAFHEDGSVCVVIDRADLQRIADGEISFYWLLHSRYEEFRFGVTREKGGQR